MAKKKAAPRRAPQTAPPPADRTMEQCLQEADAAIGRIPPLDRAGNALVELLQYMRYEMIRWVRPGRYTYRPSRLQLANPYPHLVRFIDDLVWLALDSPTTIPGSKVAELKPLAERGEKRSGPPKRNQDHLAVMTEVYDKGRLGAGQVAQIMNAKGMRNVDGGEYTADSVRQRLMREKLWVGRNRT